jgi:hypothetical protein
VVQEIGYDDDSDEQVREAIKRRDVELVDEEYDDVVDAVLFWWRDEDGDLVDALADALTPLAHGGYIWLLTPASGRPDNYVYVEPDEIVQAAATVGLSPTSSLSVGHGWLGTRLVFGRLAAGSSDIELSTPGQVGDPVLGASPLPGTVMGSSHPGSYPMGRPWDVYSGRTPPKLPSQDAAIIDVLAAMVRDTSDSDLAITQVLPICVYLETATEYDVRAVRDATRSILANEDFEVFYEDPGVWGSWLGRSFACSMSALKSEQVRDTLVRTERALEMQALLLPQAQIDATQAGAAANLIASLSNTPNAIVQIGSILIIKVEGTPIVRNLTQTELSYLEHNRHLYSSPKQALEELSRISEEPNKFATLAGNLEEARRNPSVGRSPSGSTAG